MKYLIGALVVLVLALSLVPTADAGWRSRHPGFHNHNLGVVVSPDLFADF